MINSIFYQLANVFFVLAAIFSDIILIRFSLVMGNMLLIINAALGWPFWGSYINTPNVQIDTLVWSSLALVLHSWAFFVLMLDARELKPFEDHNSESLYQYFKRRSGICRRDFLPILTKGRWTRVPAKGTLISADTDFHLIVEGYVSCDVEGWRRRDDDFLEYKSEPHRVTLRSGELFDLRFANIFNTPVGFFNTSFAATTASEDVLLFSWSIETLSTFARGCDVVAQAWRNIIAFVVSDIAHRPWLIETDQCGHRLGIRHTDFSIPPVVKTDAKKSFKEFIWWIIRSSDPRPPRGLGHAAIPLLSTGHTEMLMNDPRSKASFQLTKA